MIKIDIEKYHEQGFLLIDVLSEVEAKTIRDQIDKIFLENKKASMIETGFHSSENQHFGDEVSSYGSKTKHYYFHLLTTPPFLSIQHVFHHKAVLNAVEQIIGGPLIINNASFFAAEPGTCYNLPWHRDVIQIPQAEINEAAIYNSNRFHNSVQINWPLYDDETLWVVPGSHKRKNTSAEAEAFKGTKHYAPLDALMPGEVNMKIKPGQAVLYNNNIIHRGFNPNFKFPRRSLHLGYHCAAKPPTWHFYLLNEKAFSDEYLAQMTPTVRKMLKEYFECRRQYPKMEDTWAFCNDFFQPI